MEVIQIKMQGKDYVVVIAPVASVQTEDDMSVVVCDVEPVRIANAGGATVPVVDIGRGLYAGVVGE